MDNMLDKLIITALRGKTAAVLFENGRAVRIDFEPEAAEEELDAAQNAMNKLCLGARLIEYPCAWGERYVIAAKKLAPTPKAYPRKAGTAGKMPL